MSSYAAANYFYWGGNTPGSNYERPGNTCEAIVASVGRRANVGGRCWLLMSALSK